MQILLANGNTSDSVTHALASAARSAASPGTKIVAVSAIQGVPVIQSLADLDIARGALLETVRRYAQSFDGLLVGVSLDLALAELRQQWACPVVGMTDAGLSKARQIGKRVGVITFGKDITELFCLHYPEVDPQLIEPVDMSPATVLAARGDPGLLLRLLNAAAQRLVERGAQSVLPIGATVAGLACRVSAKVPVLDCVACAVEELERLIREKRTATV